MKNYQRSMKNKGRLLSQRNKLLKGSEKTKIRILNIDIPLVQKYKEFFKDIANLEINTVDNKITEGTEDWFNERRKRITGSIFYRVLSWSMKSTQAYKKFITPNIKIDPNTLCRRMETSIYQTIRDTLLGFKVEKGYFKISQLLPWIGATADIVLSREGKVESIVEVKTSKHSWEKSGLGSIPTGEIRVKSDLYYQLQTTMLVFEVRYCFFVFYSYDKVRIEIVKFSPQLFTDALITVQEKYLKMIVPYQILGRLPSTRKSKKRKIQKKNTKGIFYFSKMNEQIFITILKKTEMYKDLFMTKEKIIKIASNFGRPLEESISPLSQRLKEYLIEWSLRGQMLQDEYLRYKIDYNIDDVRREFRNGKSFYSEPRIITIPYSKGYWEEEEKLKGYLPVVEEKEITESEELEEEEEEEGFTGWKDWESTE